MRAFEQVRAARRIAKLDRRFKRLGYKPVGLAEIGNGKNIAGSKERMKFTQESPELNVF